MSALADPPTAYICANEATALGAFSGFHARGLVHGRDAVINATDDLNVSQYFAPPITTTTCRSASRARCSANSSCGGWRESRLKPCRRS